MSAQTEMTLAERNIAMVRQLPALIPNDLSKADALFADNFVWRYFNKGFAQIDGEYDGLAGLIEFFKKLGRLTNNTFQVRIAEAYSFGDELVVVHANPSMELEGRKIETDAAVIWRIVDGKLVEAWDIPAINLVRVL